jgi:uncharacterized protein (UPF0147 family)
MNSISFFKALLMKELNEKDGAEFTKKYNDDPKLKGGQKNLPDQLQAQIVKKEGEDNDSGGGTLKIEKQGDKYYWTWNPKSGKSQKSDDGFESKADAQRDFMRKSKYMKESEGQDHEVSMAQNSLKSIISSASQLMNMLGQDEKNIPAWIQDHITNAENYINQASKNYHEYNEGSTGEYDMDELPDGTIEEPAGDAEDIDMTLKSMMENNDYTIKNFLTALNTFKEDPSDHNRNEVKKAYNKLNDEDQPDALQSAKGLDVLPIPKNTNETSLKSIMETVVKRKKAK